MKKFILLIPFLVIGCNINFKKYNPDEVIVIVELRINKDKSEEEIKTFTKKYSEFVDETEPNTLGWTYNISGDKLVLIERYKNEEANIITAKNISPGGKRNQLLNESFNYFTLEKVSVYGGFTNKLIEFNNKTIEKVGIKAPFEYFPKISGYIRD
tara:strand:- start:86 stop:550 length:465 start_codon:yes stop_codon:yes gene_type:complete